jgi:hypothetical protein
MTVKQKSATGLAQVISWRGILQARNGHCGICCSPQKQQKEKGFKIIWP